MIVLCSGKYTDKGYRLVLRMSKTDKKEDLPSNMKPMCPANFAVPVYYGVPANGSIAFVDDGTVLGYLDGEWTPAWGACVDEDELIYF